MNHNRARSVSTPAAPAPTSLVVGIDVGKASLDLAAWPAASLGTFANDAGGHARMVQRLLQLRPRRVVVEATGGYERDLVRTLQQAGLQVARANPRAVRDFAKAHQILAKTDRIDARVIARYGHDVEPRILACADDSRENREELVARRRQLIEQRTAEKARLDRVRSGSVQQSIHDHLEHLDEQIAGLDEQIEQSLSNDPNCSAITQRLRSVKGVGPVLSTTLVTEVPELGTLSRAAVAALVGVAPFNDDSGKHKGKRFIRGGRKAVRNVLYMAAVAAVRCNTVLREHYRQLKERGKPAKVALVACMRKLLIHLNNLARSVRQQTHTKQQPA